MSQKFASSGYIYDPDDTCITSNNSNNIKTFVLGEPCKWNNSQESIQIIEFLSKELNICYAVGEIICSYLSYFSRYGCALPIKSGALDKEYYADPDPNNLGQYNPDYYHLSIPSDDLTKQCKRVYKAAYVNGRGEYCIYSKDIINYRVTVVDHPQFGTYLWERGYILNGVKTFYQEGELYELTCIVDFGFTDDISTIPRDHYIQNNIYIIGSTISGKFIWVKTSYWDESRLITVTPTEQQFLRQFLKGDKWLVLNV